MGHFYKAIDALMRSGKGEAKTLTVIKMLDVEVFEPMMHENPKKYWDLMRSMHEQFEGCHYDESFAMWQVSQMRHTNKSGVVCKGEHWPIATIHNVYTSNRSIMNAVQANEWDLYVALHSWYHDNICQDMIDFGGEAETKNINRAINYF